MSKTKVNHDEQVMMDVRRLTDRAELTELLDRFFVTGDERRWNDAWLGSLFTDDFHLEFPAASHDGLEGLAEFGSQALDVFDRVHHEAANYLLDVDGDTATVRANVIVAHVPKADDPSSHFDVGGYYNGRAVRTDDGWRLREMNFTLVWTAGDAMTSPVVDTER